MIDYVRAFCFVKLLATNAPILVAKVGHRLVWTEFHICFMKD